MVKKYQQGDVAVFRVNWLTQTGEIATPETTPTVDVKMYDDSTNSWTGIVTNGQMTQEVNSKWFYEIDTSVLTANKTFITDYKTTIDGLSVQVSEDWQLVDDKEDIVEEIRQMRKGNERIVFNYVGDMLSSMTIQTKADTASNWNNPTSEKVLHFHYEDNKLVRVGEN